MPESARLVRPYLYCLVAFLPTVSLAGELISKLSCKMCQKIYKMNRESEGGSYIFHFGDAETELRVSNLQKDLRILFLSCYKTQSYFA